MATGPNPERAAFFRWQEWQSARTRIAPPTDEGWGDLLAAEAQALADAGERDAARDAAALARGHYEVAPPSVGTSAKLRRLRRLSQSLGGPSEPEVAHQDVAASVSALELSRQLARLVARLSALQAGGVLRTINALEGTSARGPIDPFAIRHVVLSVPRGGAVEVAELVNGLEALRWADPERFGATLAELRRRAGVDPAADAGGLEGLPGDELA